MLGGGIVEVTFALNLEMRLRLVLGLNFKLVSELTLSLLIVVFGLALVSSLGEGAMREWILDSLVF